jgi:hypothetical protein
VVEDKDRHLFVASAVGVSECAGLRAESLNAREQGAPQRLFAVI